MEERHRASRSGKRCLGGSGLLLSCLLQAVPTFAQCPPGTAPSSPTSQVCVLTSAVTCPAGTRELERFSNICLLDWTAIPKFSEPLTIPPTMPETTPPAGFIGDYYELAIRQFPQQVLPTGYPTTDVWGFGSVTDAGTFRYPAYSIEAVKDTPTRVKWINDLVDAGTGDFLPHLLGDSVVQTIHWANPPAVGCDDGSSRTDCVGTDPAPYHGPVPMVVHLHGAHVTPESDGFPEAWYLPAADNIPAGYATQGSDFSQIAGAPLERGAAVFEYRNDQRATTLWYHPHDLGLSRLNVYAGLAGFFLIRDGDADVLSGTLPAPAAVAGEPLWVPAGRGVGAPPYREIPLVIQDRSFNPDGSLFYPFDTEVHEKFFGETIVVNGKTWPYQNVEPARYRLRLLNGANSRFFDLGLSVVSSSDGDLVGQQLPIWQIGSDGGLLPAPVELQQVFLAIAERADVIVDFTGLPEGTVIRMTNTEDADPGTTGQVMEFVVVPLVSADASTPPASLQLNARVDLVPTKTRKVSLNSDAMLGTVAMDGDNVTGGSEKSWADAITENMVLNDTEEWEIWSFAGDAHPIHLHQVQFQVVNREFIDFDPVTGIYAPSGTVVPPEIWETGEKDTVIAYGDTITRIRARFDIPGLFVWHCHILEHEDDEMMRPFYVSAVLPAVAGIGVYRKGAWYLDANGNNAWDGCGTDACVSSFGLPTDTPVTGDWDGTGASRIGVFRDGAWYLDLNSDGAWNGCGTDGCSGPFGAAGDRPVTGDWGGTGSTKFGVFRNGAWYLDLNGNRSWDGCSIDTCYGSFGIPTDIPVSGDWNGTGTTKIGVYRGGAWFLDLNGNGTWDGCSTDGCYTSFGVPTDAPVTGDWTGTGTTRIGVFRSGQWYVDLNGNGTWEGCAVDGCYASFGTAGDIPVTGGR